MSAYGKTTKVWLREPRIAWQNNGGPVPYRLRGYVRREGKKWRTLKSQTVGRRQWLVIAGNEPFVFPTSSMKRLYTKIAPDDRT